MKSTIAAGETHTLVEEVIKEQRFQVVFLFEGISDVFQKDTLKGAEKTRRKMSRKCTDLDDASPTPHTCDTSVVQVPPELG